MVALELALEMVAVGKGLDMAWDKVLDILFEVASEKV